MGNGLSKEEIGVFVKEHLKLSNQDTEKIQAELLNKNELLIKVQQFLNPMPEVQSDDIDMDDMF